MNCERVMGLLEQYMDDELLPELRAEVDDELASCGRCREELEALEAMREAFRAPVLAATAEASFDGLWERIEGEVGAAREPAARPPAWAPVGHPPDLWKRFIEGVRRLFAEQPFLPMGLAAAAALVLAVLLLGRPGTDVEPVGGGVAQGEGGSKGAELSAVDPGAKKSVAPVEPENNLAWVSSVEYTHGTVIIEQNQDDPAEPTIVWHYDEDAAENEAQGG